MDHNGDLVIDWRIIYKMGHNEIRCESVASIYLTHERVQWWVLMNTGKNFQVS